MEANVVSVLNISMTVTISPDYYGYSGCDNTIDVTTIQSKRLPDIACAATACPGDASEACGGPFVMALYQQPTENEEANNFFNSECRNVIQPGPQIPAGATFSLTAVFKDTPTSSMPINLAVLDPTKNYGEWDADLGSDSLGMFSFRVFWEW